MSNRSPARRLLGIVLAFCVVDELHAEDDPEEVEARSEAAEADGATEVADEVEASWLDDLELGGHVELAYERLQDFDLDRSQGDDLDLVPFEVELDLLYAPSEPLEAYLQLLFVRDFTLGARDDEVQGNQLVVEEAHATFRAPDHGLALQVGRQPFEDERQWLYDADLDGVRGFYERDPLFLELSATREALVQQDLLNQTDTEPVNNYIAYGGWRPREDLTLGAYGIVLDYRDEDQRPIFLGLQSYGRVTDRLSYWADLAHLRGYEDDRNLRGFGFDLLGAYHLQAPLSPYLVLGYAFGSGDSDPEDDRDRSFRQTGLQGNETEVGGLTPYRYYGEAFDPELSNLSIVTVGLGVWPTLATSAELVFHRYRQVERSDELRDAAIDAEPDGESRELGSEIDLVLGFEEIQDVEIRGFLGYFRPGRAFGDGADDALFGRLEVRYEF